MGRHFIDILLVICRKLDNLALANPTLHYLWYNTIAISAQQCFKYPDKRETQAA